MKERVADPRKHFAGWCIVALAVTVSIVGFVRDNGGALGGGIVIAVFGLAFVAEARRKKDVTPDFPGLRWYHVALVAAVIVVGVVLLYKALAQ